MRDRRAAQDLRMPMQDHQERADARPVPDHAMPRHNRRKDTAMQDHANVRRKGRGSVVQGWQRQGTARAAQNAPTATRRGGPRLRCDLGAGEP